MTTNAPEIQDENDPIDFIINTVSNAYNLFCFLSEQDTVSEEQYKSLLELYTTADTAIRNYYRYLDDKRVDHNDSYLTRLLTKEDMGEQLTEIEYFLDEIKH